MILFLNFLRQHRHGVLGLGVLLLAVITMVVGRTGSFQVVREVMLDVMGGMQQALTQPVEWGANLQRRVESLYRLDAENLLLNEELSRLRPRLERIEELEQENQRLRRLLGMWPEGARKGVAARVVGESSSAFARSLVVGAGERDGVTSDLPVLAPAGLVGRVVAAGERAAQVLSLLDLNSRVPVLVQRSRVRAIVAGANGRTLTLEFVPKGADLVPGDLLITSGSDGLFPKGIKVGRVQSVMQDGPDHFLKVVVVPMVDFDRLEEVRILLPAHDAVAAGAGRP